MTAKRWFELECRHCGKRFLEMATLLFHRCPGLSHAHKQSQRRARRKGQGNLRTKTQRLLQGCGGARL
jgi:hypothetical protein